MSDEIRKTVDDSEMFIGLDLSLTGTGVSIYNGQEFVTETIKTEPKNFKNDLDRVIHIRDIIMRKIPENVKMVAIEDFFAGFGKQVGSVIKLAILGTTVRLALYEKKIPFIVVAPTSLKKHILGKGIGEKDLIVREVYKRFGIETKNNDEADAVVLSHIAKQFYQVFNGKLPQDLPKYQVEVISTLLQSKAERGYNL